MANAVLSKLSGRRHMVSLRMDLRGTFEQLRHPTSPSITLGNSMEPPALQPFFWEPDPQGAEKNQHGIYTTDAHQLQPVELQAFLQESSKNLQRIPNSC